MSDNYGTTSNPEEPTRGLGTVDVSAASGTDTYGTDSHGTDSPVGDGAATSTSATAGPSSSTSTSGSGASSSDTKQVAKDRLSSTR